MRAAYQTFFSILFCILLIPLSLIIRKKRNRIVVISRQNGLFIDNAKHFFLYLHNKAEPRPEVVLLVSCNYPSNELSDSHLPVYPYPGLKAASFLLSANLVIVDSAEWIEQGKFHLAFGSKVIQLWHGAPLKQIEIPLFLDRISKYPRPVQFLIKMYKLISGRHAAYELVVSTSTYFTQKAFKPAFRARRFIESGYPRNDVFFSTREKDFNSPLFINTDITVIKEIISRKKSGMKIFLYAPTFRKDLNDHFSKDIFDLMRLDKFARQHKLFIVLKLHPVMADKLPPGGYTNIVSYKATNDIYPALNLFDVLITDYSSIYFDFLLLGRPILFFPYDMENYIGNDRSLLFDYKTMAPGPLCMKQDQVEHELLQITSDQYTSQRKHVTDLVFSHKDNKSSERLWAVLKSDYII